MWIFRELRDKWIHWISYTNFVAQNICCLGYFLSIPIFVIFVLLGYYRSWYYYLGCLSGALILFYGISYVGYIYVGFKLRLRIYGKNSLENYVNRIANTPPIPSVQVNVYEEKEDGKEYVSRQSEYQVRYPTCYSTYECDIESGEKRFKLNSIQNIHSDLSFKIKMNDMLLQKQEEFKDVGSDRKFFYNINLNNIEGELFYDDRLIARILQSTRSSLIGCCFVFTGCLHPILIHFASSFKPRRLLLNKTLTGKPIVLNEISQKDTPGRKGGGGIISSRSTPTTKDDDNEEVEGKEKESEDEEEVNFEKELLEEEEDKTCFYYSINRPPRSFSIDGAETQDFALAHSNSISISKHHRTNSFMKRISKNKNITRIFKSRNPNEPTMIFSNPPSEIRLLDNNSWFNTKFRSSKPQYRKNYLKWTLFICFVVFLAMTIFMTPFISLLVFGCLLCFVCLCFALFVQFGREESFIQDYSTESYERYFSPDDHVHNDEDNL